MNNQKVVIIARVSSREQGEGYSIEQQVKECKIYAIRKNLTIVKIFRLEESAKESKQRKMFNNDILGFLRLNNDVDAILCHKVDRFARNMQDAETLNAMGIAQIFVQMDFPQNALGTFMRRIATAQATYYVENLREEVLKGFQGCVEKGFLPCRPPYPYKTEKKQHYPDPIRTLNFLKMHKEWINNCHTLDSLKTWLKDNEIWYTDNQKYWNRSTIERLLKNPFHAGWFIFHDKMHKGNHKTIITWEEHQKALWKFSEANRGNYKKRKHVYASRLFKCVCGASITAETQKGHTYYKCANNQCVHKERLCAENRRYIREELLEKSIISDIIEPIQLNEKIATWILKALNVSIKQSLSDKDKELSLLKRQLSSIKNKLDVLLEKYLDEKVSDEIYRKKEHEYTVNIESIKSQIDSLQGQNRGKPKNEEKFIELTQHITEKWVTKDKEIKRKMLDFILSNCVWDGKNFYPEYRKPFDLLAIIKNQKRNKKKADSRKISLFLYMVALKGNSWNQIFKEMHQIYQLREWIKI